MQEQINMITTLAPCGMNCELCHSFQNKKKIARDVEEEVPTALSQDVTRESYIVFECSQYPCRRLRQLDERYRTHYNMSMIENLEFIKEYGENAFYSNNRRNSMSRLWKVTNGTLRGLHILQATEEEKLHPLHPRITILNKLTAS